jgi:diguanylate cyclase (GGDEF)-like protein/PAS domain S-box-containing protein
MGSRRVTSWNERRHAALVRLLCDVRTTEFGDRRKGIGLILGAVCRYTEWPLGHAYRLDRRSGRLRAATVWHEREPGRYRSLLAAAAGISLGSGEDLPGLALASRNPEWTRDITSEARFSRADASPFSGVRAAVAVPLLVNGSVDTVLEFFCSESMPPDDSVLSVLGHVGAEWSRGLEIECLRRQLRHNLSRFRTIMELSPDAMVLTDDSGRIVSLNPAAKQMFGYEISELAGEPLMLLLSNSSRGPPRDAVAQALEQPTGATSDQVLRLEGVTREGRVFPVELSLSHWRAGRLYVAVTLRAATERRAAEEEFRLHASAAAHARDAIVVSTVGGAGRGPTILYANAAFTRMTGYTEAEVLGRSFSVLAGANTSRTALQMMHERLGRYEPASTELIAYRKDGHEFLLEWHASPITETDGTVHHFESIQRDITDERSVEQALKRADRDGLTGLPTREILERRVRLSIQRSRERSDYRFALVFLDMDGFKAVNDERGHVVGDQLLASAARRLEGTIRPGDMLARFGGDEFVILLHYVTGTSDVVMVVERVRERMAAPFELQGSTVTVTASIGIALSDSGYSHPEELIRDADTAMYQAKRKGGGRVEFFGRNQDGTTEPTPQRS